MLNKSSFNNTSLLTSKVQKHDNTRDLIKIYLPRFGAKATSCTASVIAISVSSLCHFLWVVKTNFQFRQKFICIQNDWIQ